MIKSKATLADAEPRTKSKMDWFARMAARVR